MEKEKGIAYPDVNKKVCPMVIEGAVNIVREMVKEYINKVQY